MGKGPRLVLVGGKSTTPVRTRAPVVRDPPPAPRRVSVAAAAIEHLDMVARAREVPPDADEGLDHWTLGAGEIAREKLKHRVRLAIERFRTARPRLRLAHIERYTPGVEAHICELARRHARELVLRVRDGGADDSSVPIEVEVILEICSWFETLGRLKSESRFFGQ